jgi:hypothetical protein
MAKDPGQEDSIRELRQQIAHSRDRLARDVSGLRYELDFPLKFRKSFQRQPVVWITGAVLLGVIFTVRPGRRRKVTINASAKGKGEKQKEGLLGAGLAIGALRFAATLLRPVVVSFVTKKFGGRSRGPDPTQRW